MNTDPLDTGLQGIVRWDPADDATLHGIRATWGAAQVIDDPDGPRMSLPVLRGWLQRGFVFSPAEAWYLEVSEPGQVPGWYRLELFDQENLNRAFLLVVVHPAARGHGLGRLLLRHAAGQAAAAGRTVLDGQVRDGSAGDAFAAAAGAKSGIGATLRRLDLRTAPAGHFTRLQASAAAAAAGYSLVRWTGPTPPQYQEPLARVLNAYGDAPHDAGVEAEEWDAARVRERGDRAVALLGLRRLALAAVHDASGEMAAMTSMAIEPKDPTWGHQELTAVTREHRGHRLGLLLKSAMIEWLAEAEPQVTRIETGNAAANKHMIAVNDALGFVASEPYFHTVELDVATALRS
jgi:GNAT superfamily N-acetyltransferase